MREETTSLLNGSLITDQWFDSSRRLRAKSSNAVECVSSKSNREKVYDGGKQTILLYKIIQSNQVKKKNGLN